MGDRAVLSHAASVVDAAGRVGEFLVVLGWFGLLALALIGGVAYLRARA
jgi:hypothetical protein